MVRLLSVLMVVASGVAANVSTFSAFQSTNFSGKEFRTSGTGTHHIGFTARSYIWAPAPGSGCCVKLCAGHRETGHWCQANRNADVSPDKRFNKVVTGCGSAVLKC